MTVACGSVVLHIIVTDLMLYMLIVLHVFTFTVAFALLHSVFIQYLIHHLSQKPPKHFIAHVL